MVKKFSRIRNQLNSRLSSENKKIVIGFVTVCFFLLIGRISGAVKEIAIANRFGVSATVDAYSFVFNLIIFPVSIWFGLLSAILIPLLAKIRHYAPEQIFSFKNQIFGFTLLVGMGLTLLFNLLCPFMIKSDWIGLPPETALLAINMLPKMSSYIFIGCIISFFSVLTMSYGKHANTLLESLPGLCTFLGVIMFSGILPLIWGLIIGALLQLILLFFLLYRTKRACLPCFSFCSPWWSDFNKFFYILLIGQVLSSSDTLVDQFFSASLGEGAISTLNYANKIQALLLGLSATAINRAVLPVFSQSHFSGKNIVKTTLSWTKFLFIGGLIFIIVFYFIAEPVVKLIFERGAFTTQNTQQVSKILQISLISLPFYISTTLLMSYQASKGYQFILAKIGIINFIVKLTFCFLLVPRFAIYGILFSSIISRVITFSYACYISYKNK